ncbi:UDP-N-acetylmuramoyl-tripeptide--D-alanyl-D-alanine ligase [Idiomarina tyrosinivorans]|uniref:UDP-N-acetylmuramoyl-tripeptide--D-alanyl-D-alanine ligase n=1 Tax=Idiomarina tyrosinivorans TaxID=1445662 RepID=A0A432ZQA8_9GAMM|nr:UDP-N-acetylmuramoyl-tripeptide--D-alanyl-D-alanine ligase [Idiomarina tyrosinivorans]RUO80084.1 UDP-N-acetylmuramoyl-tripeptide--D-alanyl-D-alanine ligase [Idiomarina tyrosinivorans]
MISVTLAWIAEAVGGQLVNQSVTVDKVSTDTRGDLEGALFIALRGQHFDAHRFVNQAVERGAKALLVEQQQPLSIPQVVVADTRHALGLLGAAVKREVQPKTVAITGSNGKTTVKEMIATIMRQKYSVLATKGNLNNDIGVPLTLLALQPEHQIAVIEMGANHPGEIAYTTQLAQPDVAILNNVSAAHIEGFGSVYGVARAKTEIFKGLPEQGIGIVSADSEYLPCWKNALAKHQLLTTSDQQVADVYGSEIELGDDGMVRFTLHANQQHQAVALPLPGRHNVRNALSAAAACLALGCDLETIATGLASMKAVQGRLNIIQLMPGVRLIDDTYNASVASTKAALDLLANYSGYRILVLGDMGELGPDARAYHEEIGAHGIAVGIDNLYTLGVLSQSASEVFNGHGGKHFSTLSQLIDALSERIAEKPEQGITILVKGSRASHMERVVTVLQEHYQESEGQHAC